MNNCLFCKIANEKTDTKLVYKDTSVVAFADINPKAPVHILIIPKTHIETIEHLKKTDKDIISSLILTAQTLAREFKIDKTGYRLVFNVRDHGGQVIKHIHLHLLGGQQLGDMV